MPKKFELFPGDRIRITTNLPSFTWTWMAWVKVNSASGLYKPFFYRNNQGDPFVFVGVAPDNTFHYAWHLNISAPVVQVNGPALAVGTWYHICTVYDVVSRIGEPFLNGVSLGTAADTLAPAFSQDMLMIGSDDDNDAESGLCSMCCVKIWDNVRFDGNHVCKEMLTARALLRENLYLEMPLTSGVDFQDYSPKNNLVAVSGTITDPDMPPGVDFAFRPRNKRAKLSQGAAPAEAPSGLLLSRPYGIQGGGIVSAPVGGWS